ncbi:MAG: hypothetical protein US58_C0012G0005 [Candidatus Magasanikbacteria bacterium GW2011_GWA2_37_8]|uniref:Uncharacterized protein n=1 Tax=Candidatus Magasanikbacteria bacterium GW2011_GWA2_37_8 TaxID=1619036 RepID=A0A0G0KJN6_9BACT|nr:MAG: hypothetical protein US58_C0012G0005 [Candidatus Magasanikbacteria bacterium GW2011_GWA2_37_8]
MSPTLKKNLFAGALLATAALIGIGLYYLFQKTTPTAFKPRPVATTTPGALPTAGERVAPIVTTTGAGELVRGQAAPTGAIPQVTPSYYQAKPVTQVTTDYALFTSTNKNGGLRYHNAADGKFYRVTGDGTITEMSDQIFYNADKVTWAPTKDEAVVEYPDGNKIVYNFETKKQITLPKHWEEFSFSNDSSQIAAKSMGLSPESRWLITVNDDGTGSKLIEPMGNNADKVIIDWSPSRQTAAFSMTGQALGADRREVLFIGLNGENFKSTIVEGAGFEPQWSPTGQKLLYSVFSTRSDYKPELWVVNAYGDDIGSARQSLAINTWADKCTFAGDKVLYCAVPRNLPQGAGMLPELALGLKDDLYKIDLQTGLKTNVPLGDEYSIKNINFDSINNKLYFTDTNKTGVFNVKI